MNSKRSAAVILVMILVVTTLIWAGVHNARDRKLQMQQAQESRAMLVPAGVSGVGDDGEGQLPKLQGKPAPGFTLVDLDGKTVSLSDFKGKSVLVNFWASWCAPCKLEMPWFEEFSKKYAGQGLVILGVAADDAGKNVIAGVAKKSGITYPILLKDDKVEDAYGGVGYLPESFYVDKTGTVTLVTAGLNDGQGGKDEIEAHIKKLIAVSGQ